MISPLVNPVLHAASTFVSVCDSIPRWTPSALLRSPSSDALHLPFALTLILIPAVYGLQSGSGNVSWVDRLWTTFPVLCSALVAFWIMSNPSAGIYVASLPRILVAVTLQTIWSGRLTGHSYRRGVYNPHSEDYRYTEVRKLLPSWAFEIVHIVVVCIAQPLLLLALAFPIRCMILPPALLSAGPTNYAIRLRSFPLPASVRAAAEAAEVSPDTPVFHVGDVVVVAIAVVILAIEAWGDNAQYAFQQGKYRSIRAIEKAAAEGGKSQPGGARGRSGKAASARADKGDKAVETTTTHHADQPAAPAYAPKYFPGFETRGIHAISRHPNFAAEQLFWVTQGLLAVSAANPFARGAGWMQCALVPCFCLSLLFTASTALTEFLTTRKYPQYAIYRRVVGKFLPQETGIKWIWTTVMGTREGLERQLVADGKKSE